MASSGKADRGHPGGNGGIDACRAVFDYETASWRRAELLGGVEEEIGRRLAACDHCCAKQVIAKIRQKPGQFELMADLRRHCSTRRNGAIAAHRATRQLRQSVRAIAGTQSRSFLRRAQHKRPAVHGPTRAHDIKHFRIAHPAEALDQSFFRNRIAASGQHWAWARLMIGLLSTSTPSQSKMISSNPSVKIRIA
jgi:hypothetical protein